MKTKLIPLISFLVVLFFAACQGPWEEETPVEQKEAEAGVEEVIPEPSPEETRVEEVVEPAKPTPEEIQAKGCPEGQVSNEAGTECYPEEYQEAAQDQIMRMQSQDMVRRFEAGEFGTSEDARLECQVNKAVADLGIEGYGTLVSEMIEEQRSGASLTQQTQQEMFAQRGYVCEEPPAPPTPEELDKKYEKADPKRLEQQCSPESNASPAFREKYC
jgi:hypothetical protein